MMKKAMAEAPNGWLAYVMVENVEATVKTARELGAKIIVEKMVVPGGTFAVLADPTGAAFGIWQVQK
jgi:uncharacterized protein